MNNPLVSVVIAAFNCENYIKQAIQSILNQTYENIELILVDDCSTDSTVKVIQEFSDARIVLIRNGENMGVSKSRNIGIASSSGKYITQLDGDDFAAPDKIANELQVCDLHRSAAFSEYLIVSKDGSTIRSGFKFHKNRARLKWFGVIHRTQAFGRDWMIPRSIAELVSYDEKLTLYEDWDYKLQVMKLVDVYFSDSVGTHYRQTGTGLASVNAQKHSESLHQIFLKHSTDSQTFKTLFSKINRQGKKYKSLKLLVDWVT